MNDYLWDKSAPADPEVERLERLLGRFRYRGSVPAPRARIRHLRPWLAAAAGVAAALAAVLVPLGRGGGYRVAGVEGRTRVSAGEVLEVVGRSARLRIADLGEVELEPGSRLAVESVERGHAFYLERGRLTARIDAAPRLFQVGTPAGVSIDLGCVYTLAVAEDGETLLEVSTGQVAFAFEDREVYVPAGASCRSVPGRGPSPPVFDDAQPTRKLALDRCAAGLPKEDDLAHLLDLSDRDDALPLFALLFDPAQPIDVREKIYDRFRHHFHLPPESEIPRAAVLGCDGRAREAWLDSLRSNWRRAEVWQSEL